MEKTVRWLKNAASKCLQASRVLLTLSEKRCSGSEILRNWLTAMVCWACVGLMFFAFPYINGILVCVQWFVFFIAVCCGCALLCAVPAVLLWLCSLPFIVLSYNKKIKESVEIRQYNRFCEKINNQLQKTENNSLHLSKQDLRYVVRHPEIIKNVPHQILQDIQTGKINLSLPDDIGFNKRILPEIIKSNAKNCLWNRSFYGSVRVVCDWKTCARNCPISCKTLDCREEAVAEQDAKIRLEKNSVTEKVYFNKYMAHMSR